MKIKISKTDYENLKEELKKHASPVEGDENSFELNLEEGTQALLNAKEHEKEQRKEAEKDKKKAEERIKELETKINESKDKNDDTESLNKSWQEKFDRMLKEKNEEISQKDTTIKEKNNYINNNMIETEAMKIASEISKKPAAMLLNIKARLKVDETGEVPVIKVLDNKGKESALTIDELKTEFKKDETWADLIIASKATGSASTTNQTGSAGTNTEIDLGTMSTGNLKNHIEAKINSQKTGD